MLNKFLRSFKKEKISSRITFERNGDQYGLPLGIFTINPDGSECEQIRTSGFAPEWSPDGKWIAFQDVPPGYEFYATNIFVMKANGKKTIQLTKYQDCAAACPTWSPDSKQIVYCTWKNQAHQIMSVSINDSMNKHITSNGSNGYPVWTPGNDIVFLKEDESPNLIYIMEPDGSNQRPLDIFQPGDMEPTWSRDGTKITFIRNGGIHIMNSDGTDLKDLKLRGAIEVSFSPDGNQICYSARLRESDGFGAEIFIANIDGSNVNRITETPFGPNMKEASTMDVCWSPWL